VAQGAGPEFKPWYHKKKELNVNYKHYRMKQIIVHKFSLVLRQMIFMSGWD
jgi:hypothetical protein